MIENSIEKPVQEERTAELEMSTEREVKGKNSVDNSFITEIASDSIVEYSTQKISPSPPSKLFPTLTRMFIQPTIPGTSPQYSLLVTSTDVSEQSESSVPIPASTQGTLTLTKQLQPTEKQPWTTTQVDSLTKKLDKLYATAYTTAGVIAGVIGGLVLVVAGLFVYIYVRSKVRA
jgi:hypothetical protein